MYQAENVIPQPHSRIYPREKYIGPKVNMDKLT